MFRLLVVVLAVMGLASLFGGTAAGGLAALLFFPILLLKIAFFVMLLGFIGRRIGRWDGRWDGGWDGGWDGSRHGPRHRRHDPRREPREPRRSDEERFDEWHRMAHAREEVDSWVEHLPGTEPQ